jgi:UDP-N-acetylmuramoyl-L-alanyl-D-glutamate--2,6-diaminopimelate ligase
MKLSQLIQGIASVTVKGNTDAAITALIIDSRKVEANTLFVAMKGTQTDGHSYIPKAIEQGATAILCEVLPTMLQSEITYIQVADVARSLGLMASNFYGNPSQKLTLVGVTGTNGKTTTATLLFRLFRKLGYRCGLLSTVQNQIEDEIIPSTHTTPDAVSLQALLAQMVAKGVSHAFMEVSSHAVAQERIAGLTFAGGIFTNITHDHLDFHGTFDNYIKAKKRFFDQLPKSAFALVNVDDKRGMVMLQNTAARRETFALKTLATFHGRLISDSLHGLQMDVAGREVWFKLIGTFNAYNLLGVYGAAILMGENEEEVLLQLSGLQTAPGRFEQVISPKGVVGIIDYAHTPDALQNVLETIGELKQGKVITVVGCGGNRDATKRPIMAEIACRYSDTVVLTSDNPRNEDPLDILAQMQAGVSITDKRKVITIPDRRKAIAHAVALATHTGDVVLVAGKGHENYQEIKGVKYHFDDKEELIRISLK